MKKKFFIMLTTLLLSSLLFASEKEPVLSVAKLSSKNYDKLDLTLGILYGDSLGAFLLAGQIESVKNKLTEETKNWGGLKIAVRKALAGSMETGVIGEIALGCSIHAPSDSLACRGVASLSLKVSDLEVALEGQRDMDNDEDYAGVRFTGYFQ